MKTEQIAEHVIRPLSETCDAYLIIAYTTDGELIVARNAQCPRDARAIDDVLHQIVDEGGVGSIEEDPDDSSG